MQPNVYFDPTQTFERAPSHTAYRLRYAEAARRNEFVESYDVTGAYARAPADSHLKVRFHQPRRSDETFTMSGHNFLIVNAQQVVPNTGNRWEKHRNSILSQLGWKDLSSEQSAFVIFSADRKSYATTDDLLLSSNNLAFLHHHRDRFLDIWDISIEVPVTQNDALKVQRTANSITISAPNISTQPSQSLT